MFDTILNTYNTFYIASQRKEVCANEANRFLVDALEKGVDKFYLGKIVKVIKEGKKIALNKLIN